MEYPMDHPAALADGRNRQVALRPSFGADGWFRRGVTTGAAVLAAALGLMIGGGLGESYAGEKYDTTSPSMAAQQSLGIDFTDELNDLFGDNSPF